MWNRFLLWLARKGYFRYQGLRGFHPSWWPEGYVEYHDLKGQTDTPYSTDMALGDACAYAKMFKGTVHLKGTGPRDGKP